MGFQSRSAPFNDLLILDRKMIKFLYENLCYYDLTAATLNEE